MARITEFKGRTQLGATLSLVAAMTMFICIIGLAAAMLIKTIGGAGQVQNATDAGLLALTRDALKEKGVKLEGREKLMFGDCEDSNGLITLRTYNRAVAKAMLVGLNARAMAEKNPRSGELGLRHAKEMLEIVQTGQNSIGKRLRALLLNTTSTATPEIVRTCNDSFMRLAGSNSVRMADYTGSSGPKLRAARHDNTMGFIADTYRCAYMERNGASNIYYTIKDAKLRSYIPAAAFVNENGHDYLRGYQPIDIGRGLVYHFVPMQPGQQPHLVAKKVFETNLTPVLDGNLPPNGFSCAGNCGEAGTPKFASLASAVIGCLTDVYPVSIPGGFIRVTNLPGIVIPGQTPVLKSAFTDELAAGVFVGADKDGKPVVFSTDDQALQELIAGNTAGRQPGNLSNFFNAKGDPASTADLAQVASTSTVCTALNVTDPNPDPICRTMLASIVKAYPPETVSQITTEGHVYMAAEKFGYDVNVACYYLQSLGYHYWVTGLAGCADIYPPAGYSGLRKWSVNWIYLSKLQAQAMVWSRPGTIPELLQQIGRLQALQEIKQRIQEIKPAVTDAEIDTLLAATPVDMSANLTKMYIYMDKDGKLVMSFKPPTTNASVATTDGTTTIYSGRQYTIESVVNPPADAGTAFDRLFESYPPRSVAGVAIDEAVWTTSTGYFDCLGEIGFRHRCQGGGRFCGPN